MRSVQFEIVLCRNVYKGSNPFLCASCQKGFRIFRKSFLFTVFRLYDFFIDWIFMAFSA